MKKESQVIFDRNVVEFVTVAAEFCKFLEQTETMKRSVFVDTSLKILPLLYLKASMLPKCETIGDEALETFVTEETYEILRMNLAGILAEKDDYLDVFVSDMKVQRPAHHQKHFRGPGRHLSRHQRFYLRIPAGTQRDDERFTCRLPGTLRPILGTKAGEHPACPARCEVQPTG